MIHATLNNVPSFASVKMTITIAAKFHHMFANENDVSSATKHH